MSLETKAQDVASSADLKKSALHGTSFGQAVPAMPFTGI
jgi:hypothetical protein